MKNLIKILIALVSVLFLVSVFATMAHAQTFKNFLDSLSVVHRLPYGTQKNNLKLESVAYGNSNLITLWERYKAYDPKKMSNAEFVYPKLEILTLDSIVIKINYVLPTKTDSLSEGDILMNLKYKKKSDSLLHSEKHLYNYTKGWYVSTKLVDKFNVTELCKKLLENKYKKVTKKFRYWIVGNYSPQRVASKIKCIKEVFSFDRGKKLGSTPKRTDVKRNLLFGLIRSIKTCEGYSVWFGLFKQKNN